MIIYALAIIVLLLGIGLIAVAYLSAHRTIIPVIRQAVYLWWPGLALIVLSLVIALAPSVVTYSQCQSACDVVDGQVAQHDFAASVGVDYKACVNSGLNEIKRNVFERIKDGATGLDPNTAAAEAEPGIREVCEGMVVGQCVAVCYNPQPGETEKAAKDAANVAAKGAR